MRNKAGMKFDCILEEPLDFIDINYTHLNMTVRYEKRPHGEWIQVTARDGEYYCYHKCTNCGQTIESGFDNPPLFNFCPQCGASMKKEGEAE